MDDPFAQVVLLIVGAVVFCLVVPTAMGVGICLAFVGVQRLFGKPGVRSVDSPNPPGAGLFPPRSFSDRPPRSGADVCSVDDAVPPQVTFDDIDSDRT